MTEISITVINKKVVSCIWGELKYYFRDIQMINTQKNWSYPYLNERRYSICVYSSYSNIGIIT
jgi:hypothetical protein